MTPEQFVVALRKVVLARAVDGTIASLEHPPGRCPEHALIESSAWYHNMSDNDRSVLRHVLTMTAHQSVFGVLAVLDGVRAVEDDPEKGIFRLIFQKGSKEMVLNPPDGLALHELLNQQETEKL